MEHNWIHLLTLRDSMTPVRVGHSLWHHSLALTEDSTRLFPTSPPHLGPLEGLLLCHVTGSHCSDLHDPVSMTLQDPSLSCMKRQNLLLSSALQDEEREASPRSQKAAIGQPVSAWSEIALPADFSLRLVFINFYYLMVQFLT